MTSSLHVNNNNDTNYINWYLNLDDNMKDLLMEAVLSGSQIYHLPLCSLIAVPKWQCYRIAILFFPCFWSFVCGLDIVLIKFRLFLYSFSEV